LSFFAQFQQDKFSVFPTRKYQKAANMSYIFLVRRASCIVGAAGGAPRFSCQFFRFFSEKVLTSRPLVNKIDIMNNRSPTLSQAPRTLRGKG
jgi:hypothetical protein